MELARENKMPEAHFQSLEDLESFYWWHQNRIALSQSWLQRVGVSKPRMLDMGCGTGGFLDQLAKRLDAAQVLGVETSAAGIDACNRKGIEVASEDLMQPLELTQKDFDVATAMDVMEHLPDEGPLLQSVLKHLREGGFFLASVPAMPWLFSSWDTHLGHYRRYTTKSLRRAVEAQGFKVLRCSYAFSYALPPAIIRRVIGRGYSEASCVFPEVSKPINALLKWCGACERALLKFVPMPLGLSVYILAQKEDR